MTEKKAISKTSSLLIVLACYVITGVFAVFMARFLWHWNPFYNLLITDIAATILIYLLGIIIKNASLYDAYWSVKVPFFFAFWMYLDFNTSNNLRQYIVGFLMLVWAVRLTYNWARGWHGLHEMDWRYEDLKKQHGSLYWLINLFGIHLFPTLLVYLSCLPFSAAVAYANQDFNWIDYIAIAITALGIFYETVADEQLRTFKKRNTNPENFIQEGLWKHSRHPNYFGEVSFWWGIFLFGLAANPTYWYTIVGAVSITLLFIGISIPMMEKKVILKRPAYKGYQQKVSALFPWRIN